MFRITSPGVQPTPIGPPQGPAKWLKYLHIGALHAAGVDGSGITIAVIDTGCDPTHEYLAPAIIGGRSFIPSSEPNDWADRDGHGSHCAGVIRQVAPGVKLLIVKGLDDQGHGEDKPLAAAIRWCIQQKVQIISASWGSQDEGDPEVHAAVREADAAGILFVAAAGNDGHRVLNVNTVNYPAKWQEPIAVAATMQLVDEAPSFPAFFSSAGDEVDVAAPGMDVISCAPGGAWVAMSGTSMATPLVAAFIALLMHRWFLMIGRWPTPTETLTVLLWSTRDISRIGRDPLAGVGEIDSAPIAVRRLITITPGATEIRYRDVQTGKEGASDAGVPARIEPPGRFVAGYRGILEAAGAEVTFDPQGQVGKAALDVIPD